MMSTSETLIGQLREPGNSVAWSRFVHLYSAPLYQWVRRKGLQDADAADVIQQVFGVLVVKLPEFEYDRDRSFRKWLQTITLNIWRNHCRQSARSVPLSDALDHQIGAGDLFSETDYRRQVLGRAMEIIRPEFSPRTWQAFEEHGLQSKPADEVARELGTTVGAVYAARCRVVGRLRTFLEGMLD
jgi:RNA polymerase sigma-70 factor (ECF subfamily)